MDTATNPTTAPTTTDLDTAVKAISGFDTWAAMQAAMIKDYVPTLRTDSAVCPTTELRAATILVIEACKAGGFRIYAPVYEESDAAITTTLQGGAVRNGHKRGCSATCRKSHGPASRCRCSCGGKTHGAV